MKKSRRNVLVVWIAAIVAFLVVVQTARVLLPTWESDPPEPSRRIEVWDPKAGLVQIIEAPPGERLDVSLEAGQRAVTFRGEEAERRRGHVRIGDPMPKSLRSRPPKRPAPPEPRPDGGVKG